MLAASLTTSIGAIAGSVMVPLPIEMTGIISVAGLGGTGLLMYMKNSTFAEKAKALVQDEAMVSTYKRLYARKSTDKDEYLSALWARAHDHLILGLSPTELKHLDKVKSIDLKELERILEYD
jgi:hypothetical protein